MGFFDFFRSKKQQDNSGDVSWMGAPGVINNSNDSDNDAADSASDAGGDAGGGDGGGGGGDGGGAS